jgi:hypothetical protein
VTRALASLRPVVLAPPRGPLRAGARWLLVGALVAAAAGAGYLRGWHAGPGANAPAHDGSAPLREQLHAAQAALRLAQAHGAELERQLDTLQQRLQATQEELSFLRQARARR